MVPNIQKPGTKKDVSVVSKAPRMIVLLANHRKTCWNKLAHTSVHKSNHDQTISNMSPTNPTFHQPPSNQLTPTLHSSNECKVFQSKHLFQFLSPCTGLGLNPLIHGPGAAVSWDVGHLHGNLPHNPCCSRKFRGPHATASCAVSGSAQGNMANRKSTEHAYSCSGQQVTWNKMKQTG